MFCEEVLPKKTKHLMIDLLLLVWENKRNIIWLTCCPSSAKVKKGEERRMREIKGSRIFVNVEITKSLCDNVSEFLSLDDVGFGSSVEYEVCVSWMEKWEMTSWKTYALIIMRSRVHISYLWLLIALRNKGCTRDDDHIWVCLILTTMSEQPGI